MNPIWPVVAKLISDNPTDAVVLFILCFFMLCEVAVAIAISRRK